MRLGLATRAAVVLLFAVTAIHYHMTTVRNRDLTVFPTELAEILSGLDADSLLYSTENYTVNDKQYTLKKFDRFTQQTWLIQFPYQYSRDGQAHAIDSADALFKKETEHFSGTIGEDVRAVLAHCSNETDGLPGFPAQFCAIVPSTGTRGLIIDKGRAIWKVSHSVAIAPHCLAYAAA